VFPSGNLCSGRLCPFYGMVYGMVCTEYFVRCALYGDVQDLGELRSWGHLSVSVSCVVHALCVFETVHVWVCVYASVCTGTSRALRKWSRLLTRRSHIRYVCTHAHTRLHTHSQTHAHTHARCMQTQVGTPGVAWGADERSAWKALQVNKRSYADEVLRYTQEQEMCVRVCVCTCASVCMCL